ncbi:hypothetical protein BGZ94_005274 [Podila epigama]|nr:hypothetical protein BGZ94_005274 [Podila epigama]
MLLPGEAILATFDQPYLCFGLTSNFTSEVSLQSAITKNSHNAKKTLQGHGQHHRQQQQRQQHYHQTYQQNHLHQPHQQQPHHHHHHNSFLSNPITSFLVTANPFGKGSHADPLVMPLHHHAQRDTGPAHIQNTPVLSTYPLSPGSSYFSKPSENFVSPPPPQAIQRPLPSRGPTSTSTESPATSSASTTSIVLTNYSICLMTITLENDREDALTLIQVVLGSIASMELTEDQRRIDIELKFDTLQYTILQDAFLPGPPVTAEIFSELRRIVYGARQGTLSRFPFLMGPAMIEKERARAAKDKEHSNVASVQQGARVANFWTAEEIYSVPVDESLFQKDFWPSIEHSPEDALSSRARGILGWVGGYDVRAEFERLGFDAQHWSIEGINMDFELSPTYPQRFIMPRAFLDTSVTPLPERTSKKVHRNSTVRPSSSYDPVGSWNNQDSSMTIPALSPPSRTPFPGELPEGSHYGSSGRMDTASAPPRQQPGTRTNVRLLNLVRFRSNGRFPMISWKSPRSGLVLMRCSQPMVGLLSARGPEDELYVKRILETAASEHGTSAFLPKLCIMDARAYSSAVANGYLGGGRENASNYPNATISFMSLGNIHAIASSHTALLKAVATQAESSNWHALIESTGWLTHVAELLKAASGRDGIVGKMSQDNYSHCTDGWDRTTQLVSLAQILLDPFYRTIHGLRVLIEKEWVHAGHPFQSRTDTASKQTSTTFTPSPEEESDSWRTPVIHSSPNGAKESLFYSPASPRRETPAFAKQEPKQIPSFSYHMNESRPESSVQDRQNNEHQRRQQEQHEQQQKKQQQQQYRYPPLPLSSTPPLPIFSAPSPSLSSEAQRSLQTALSDMSYMTQGQKPVSNTPLQKHEQSKIPSRPESPPPPPPPSSMPQPPLPSHSQAKVPVATSPVFILFMTCLHHIVQQHPNQFEYNDYLLVVLARAAQGGVSPFGDFLFNCERERRENRLRESTASIWSWIHRNRGWFTNRDYCPPVSSVLLQTGSQSRTRTQTLGHNSGGTRQQDDDAEDWRQDVLTVQTGGRVMTIWSEYYFDATPAWVPDPRTVFTDSVASIVGIRQDKASRTFDAQRTGLSSYPPLLRASRNVSDLTKDKSQVRRTRDPWNSSMFDQSHVQQLAFPGFVAPRPVQEPAIQSPDMSRQKTLKVAAAERRIVIPPALAMVRGGTEMHEYYMLIQYLRNKRRAKVLAAFQAWHKWAEKRVEARQARDAGWGLVVHPDNGYEDDAAAAAAAIASDDEWKKRKPKLVVKGAKKGVEVEMDRVIMASEPFFGRGPCEYEDETASEEEVENKEDTGVKGVMVDHDDFLSEEVDGFDDFGFPMQPS